MRDDRAMNNYRAMRNRVNAAALVMLMFLALRLVGTNWTVLEGMIWAG